MFPETLRNMMKDESALVFGWFEAFRVLVLTAFLYVIVGYFMDYIYEFVQNNLGLYPNDALYAIESTYGWFSYIPLIVLLLIFVFSINYALWIREN